MEYWVGRSKTPGNTFKVNAFTIGVSAKLFSRSGVIPAKCNPQAFIGRQLMLNADVHLFRVVLGAQPPLFGAKITC